MKGAGVLSLYAILGSRRRRRFGALALCVHCLDMAVHGWPSTLFGFAEYSGRKLDFSRAPCLLLLSSIMAGWGLLCRGVNKIRGVG